MGSGVSVRPSIWSVAEASTSSYVIYIKKKIGQVKIPILDNDIYKEKNPDVSLPQLKI